MYINLYLFIPTVILILVFWYMRRRKELAAGGGAKAGDSRPGMPSAPKVAKVKDPPEVVFMNLRKKVLETPRESLGLPDLPDGARPAEPYGLVMEMGIPKSVVTLACFANGDAGVYYQTGGGMKGGIAHESVRKAAKEFTAMAEKALPKMTRATGQPVPGPGRVRFYALTSRGLLTVETDREALGDPDNQLSPLFYSGQEVVSQMREVQEQRRAESAV